MTNTEIIAVDLLIGIDEIAAELGLSHRRAYELCKRQHLPAFKLGGMWHARRSSLLAHFECLEKGELPADHNIQTGNQS
jgi:hypothetical protein